MKNLKYILMVLLGGAMYGTMSSFVKLSYAKGFNAAEVAFAQALLAALFLGACALPDLLRKRVSVSAKEAATLALAGIPIGLTNYLYYQSVSLVSASLAIIALMQFTWVCLMLEWLCYGKRPSRLEITTAALVLLGTVLASGISSSGVQSISLEGVALALISSATYAAYIVANGSMGKGMHWHIKSCLIMATSAATIFLVNCKTIALGSHYGVEFLPWALFTAVLGTTVPTALFAAAIPRIDAGISSILMTVELPVAVICAHLVLGEHVGALQAAGVAIMLVSISFMNYCRTKPERKRKTFPSEAECESSKIHPTES